MSWWTEEKQRREGKKEGEGKGRRRKRNGLCSFAKIAAGAHTWSRGRWPGLFDHVHANHCCRAPGSVSVRPPVCPSVRYWYWLKTDDRTIMQFTPSGRPWSLSFSDNNFHTLDPRDPLANASNETGWAKWRKNASFSINKSLHLGNDRRTEKMEKKGRIGHKMVRWIRLWPCFPLFNPKFLLESCHVGKFRECWFTDVGNGALRKETRTQLSQTDRASAAHTIRRGIYDNPVSLKSRLRVI